MGASDVSAALSQLSELHGYFNFVERSTTDTASKNAAVEENTARPASAEITYVSTGIGRARVAKPLRFPVVFRNEPHFTQGSGTVSSSDPNNWHDPVGQAGVWRWLRDADGNFTGAFIWTEVSVYPRTEGYSGAQPKVSTRHFLTFSATAVKTVPTANLDPGVTPHYVDALNSLKTLQKAIAAGKSGKVKVDPATLKLMQERLEELQDLASSYGR